MNKQELESYFENTRKDFPILDVNVNNKKLIYFDNGATSQTPKVVIESIANYYSKINSNVHRGIHSLSEKSTDEFEKARVKISKFINCSKEEIVFTKGTTNSINQVAFGLIDSLNEGDEIILSSMEHHANIVPWQEVTKRKKCILRFVGLDDNFRLNLEELYGMLNEKTKIVALTHVSNVLGTVNPIKEISKRVHEFGALVVVDGAQGVPAMRVDVKELGCDFYAFSAHKMYGPTGVGILYGKSRELEKLVPLEYGGSMIKDVDFQYSTYQKSPFKFEAGTPNIADIIALGKTIDYIEGIGLDKISLYKEELVEHFLKKLEENNFIKLYGPKDKIDRVPVFSISLDKFHSNDISTLLDKEGIATRSGHHCAIPLMKSLGVSGTCRVSLAFYNTKLEIDKLFLSLNKINKISN